MLQLRNSHHVACSGSMYYTEKRKSNDVHTFLPSGSSWPWVVLLIRHHARTDWIYYRDKYFSLHIDWTPDKYTLLGRPSITRAFLSNVHACAQSLQLITPLSVPTHHFLLYTFNL